VTGMYYQNCFSKYRHDIERQSELEDIQRLHHYHGSHRARSPKSSLVKIKGTGQKFPRLNGSYARIVTTSAMPYIYPSALPERIPKFQSILSW